MEDIIGPIQYNGGHTIETHWVKPYSKYSQNNRYVLYVYCASETPSISLVNSIELELIGTSNGGLGKAYWVKFTEDEEDMFRY